VAAAGFGLAAVSGIGLLASNGSEYAGNPFLLVKFPAIGLGLANAVLVNRSSAWRAVRAEAATPVDLRRLSVMAVVSMVCWTSAIAAGRMIGYW
jgi:microcompartment protein CcmK/EutM